MGMFKDMKRMKDSLAQAPEQIALAQQMGAQAQQLGAAQQAAAAQQMASFTTPAAAPAAGAASREPIAGVSLELYAEISRDLASVGYDQSQAARIAESKGVSGENWQAALDGWNARITADRSVGAEFNRLYTGGA